MKAKEFYSSLSLQRKVDLYNEIVAPNNEDFSEFPYMMQLGETTLKKYLDYLGYQRFGEILADSVGEYATLDMEYDTHIILDLEDDLMIGINILPFSSEDEKENLVFDETFGDGIIDALENDTRYMDKWDK